jgi:hypothetical protein
MIRQRSVVFIVGLLLLAGAYSAVYFQVTAKSRALAETKTPELLWLKDQFGLNEADFQRICQLHDGYLPKCEEMCVRIASKNAELRTILAQTNSVTPAINKKLAEIAALRSECQANMLQHFYDVSRAMPEEQGKRYLEWIHSKTLQCGDAGMEQHGHPMQ